MFRNHRTATTTATPADAIMAADAPTIPPINAPHGAATVTGPRHARKQRRIFMWSFLAVQALYVVWIITGIHAGATTATPGCTDPDLCHAAAQAGTAIGAAMVVMLWVLTDIILGIGRWVVLTSRRRHTPAVEVTVTPAHRPDMMP